MTTQALGEGGFRWFIGKVVNREDPLKMGRVRIRVMGVHDDETDAPDESLPWGTFINPPQSASMNEIGISPTGAMVGSMVVGFFADGAEGQQPLIFGTIAGFPGLDSLGQNVKPEIESMNSGANHDVSKVARGIIPNHITTTKDANRVIDEHVTEPEYSKYNAGGEAPDGTPGEGPAGGATAEYYAKYPFNKVIQSETGNVIELDDSEGNSRIHIFHNSGSYTEYRSNGDKIDKTQSNNFVIISENNDVFIGKACNIKVIGNVILNVANGSVTANVSSDVTLHSGGNILVTAADTITMKAKLIQLNPDTQGGGSNTADRPTKSRFAGWENPNKKYHRTAVT